MLFGGDGGLVFETAVPDKSHALSIVVPDSRGVPQSLLANGYRFSHCFALLPSKQRTRWLVPRSKDWQKASGLEMYPSFSIRAVVYKTFASRMATMGWPGWSANSLWVASKERFPIENLVEDITGESQPQFALSLGTAGSSRKLTVQVMRRDGKILGYIKLPLTNQADTRIQTEARMLQRLNGNARLQEFIPLVLYASEWHSSHILFQESITGDPGPTRLTACHDRIFDAMHSVQAALKPGERVARDVDDRASASLKRLGSKWECLAADTLRVAAGMLSGADVRCGLGHGDFAPWNTRVSAGKLCVFDWEMASWDVPLTWDKFHFLVQTRSLLRRGNGVESLGRLTNEDYALYLLYLLWSTANLVDDAGPAYDIDYRESQIRKQLEIVAAWNRANADTERRGASIGA